MTTGLELLDALALGPTGVQINATKKMISVSTRYTPLVRGNGTTLIEATMATVQKVVSHYKKWGNVPKPVMDAIRMYATKNKIRMDSI